MNRKLLFGICIPVLVIIFLILLSINPEGFVVDTHTIPQFEFKDLFSDWNESRAPGTAINRIILQTTTVKNDYFIPRKIRLKAPSACLFDRDGNTKGRALAANYNVGVLTANGIKATTSDRFYSTEVEIDLKPQQEVEVELYYDSRESKNRLQYFDHFDEILLVRSTKNYIPCMDLTQEEIDSAVRIPIVKE